MIYNPKDCWHEPYFVLTLEGVYKNPNCSLKEKEYETLCEMKGLNPIYPPVYPYPLEDKSKATANITCKINVKQETIRLQDEGKTIEEIVATLGAPRQYITQILRYRETTAEKIARKRKEIGHPVK